MDGSREVAERERLFAAAVDLVSSGSAAFKTTARRYSLCVQDAEDAYQRSLEILITKAPTDDRLELRPWLHTVVKHEALAVRRQRERLLGGDAEVAESTAATAPGPEEDAAAHERRRRTGEALGQLKPSEVKCLLLKALGYSYDEIATRTGFSWTKVNRSLTEGRRSFLERFAQLEAGGRCQRFEPMLSAASDGEASRQDERELRTHLRGCQSCRAALRAYRAAPARLAELVPPALVLPIVEKATWSSRLWDTLVAGPTERAGALGHKLQHAAELLSSQKAGAVVASTAALAGGAVATERASNHDAHRSVIAREARAEDRARPAPKEEPAPPSEVQAPAALGNTERGGASPPATGTEAPAEGGEEFGPEAAEPKLSPAPATSDAGGFETAAAEASAGPRSSGGRGRPAGGEFGP
jgi:RNA polymerase sigma factor (sigma-70 family)